jgi:hypothetical protein
MVGLKNSFVKACGVAEVVILVMQVLAGAGHPGVVSET